MTQAAEMALREAIEKCLEEHPLREVVYIKIVNNKPVITDDIKELEEFYYE